MALKQRQNNAHSLGTYQFTSKLKSRLFKYVHPDRISIIKNLSVRFTQPSELNDPFELLLNIASLMSEDYYKDVFLRMLEEARQRPDDFTVTKNDIDKYFPILPEQHKAGLATVFTREMLPKIADSFRNPAIAESLTTNQPELGLGLKNDLDTIYGVLSLTTRNDNLTMWSHYADNHRGMVIEFNPESQLFDNSGSQFRVLRQPQKVTYSKRRPSSVVMDTLKTGKIGFTKLLKSVFFTKSWDWKYEQEVRMLTPLNDPSLLEGIPGVFLKAFTPESISNIYFGINSTADFKNSIFELLDHSSLSHVKTFTGFIHDTEYKISFSEIFADQ